MSEVLQCDVCGTLSSRAAAPRNGWIGVKALAELEGVVPDDHPLGGGRHLCSTNCFGAFSHAVVGGLPLSSVRVLGPDAMSRPVRGTLTPSITSGQEQTAPTAIGRDTSHPPVGETSRVRVRSGKPSSTGRKRKRSATTDASVTSKDLRQRSGVSANADPSRLSGILQAADARGEGRSVDLRLIAVKPPPKRHAS